MNRRMLTLMLSLGVFFSAVGAVTAEDEKEDAKKEESKKPVAIKGKVIYDDKPKPPKKINPGVDPYCAKHKIYDDSLRMTRKGELSNIFVYVTTCSLEEEMDVEKLEVPKEPVVLDQKGCQYEPHVFGLMSGQTLEVRNSDKTNHNVHGLPKKNKEFNFGQPKPGMVKKLTDLKKEETFMIKCDVHAWMSTWCHIMEHPYFATTDSKGEFEITGLPPGEYDLVFWHESETTVEKKSIKVEEGKPADVGEVKFKIEQKRRRR